MLPPYTTTRKREFLTAWVVHQKKISYKLEAQTGVVCIVLVGTNIIQM